MVIAAGIRIGRYEVGKKIGQGGFGVLHVARDTELGREIAIKFLRPEHAFKPEVVQRFLQEARAAARINHPGIVTVFESGQVSGTGTRADGTVYIAMELLAGDTLVSRIRQGGRVPVERAIGIARQLASALGAAHAAGIVHRDLKPHNVFLVRDAAVVGGERVKILDFGIAKLVDGFGANVQTHSLVMLGTPMYMSPEQCKSSAKVDARSDIYSLGCMLFEMLCGRTPFDGDSGELIAKHQLVPPPTARSIVAELPPDLDRLIAAMLAKAPAERPQTMDSVVDALDALAGHEEPSTIQTRGSRKVAVPTNDPQQDSTLTEAAADVSAQRPDVLRARSKVLVGAAAAIVLGVSVGLFAARDPDPPPRVVTASPTVVADPRGTSPDAALPAHPSAASPDGGAIDRDVGRVPPDNPFTPDPQRDGEVLPDPARDGEGSPGRAEQGDASTKVEGASGKAKPTSGGDSVNAKPTSGGDSGKAMRTSGGDSVKAKPTSGGDSGKAKRGATESATPAAACDAEALKELGMKAAGSGAHVAALSRFEASLRCKSDPYVNELAFMAACNSGNPTKAKHYYAKISSMKQQRLAVICTRNSVDYQ